MSYVSMSNLSNMQKYWLITGSIGPRPIGLVTSCTENGHCNAAPFSSFTYMGEDPPLMVIGIDRYGEESHRLGEKKDTLHNILTRREFVVNMVDEGCFERMVRCASDFPAQVSEPETVGFDLAASSQIKTPRIADAPVAWECVLFKVFEFSALRTVVFGEIIGMYFRDDLLDEAAMRVRVDRFSPYGRLGGPNYCRTSDRVRAPVPSYDKTGKPRV
jgi:flavin reductase (DIM6/NTAB) family NADH-FMN oxidoreductase RutF